MSEAVKVILSIVILLICIALFIGSYLLNKRTSKPEGCMDMSEHCEGCQMLSCSHHPVNNVDDSTTKDETSSEETLN